jgi:hypothetical protein
MAVFEAREEHVVSLVFLKNPLRSAADAAEMAAASRDAVTKSSTHSKLKVLGLGYLDLSDPINGDQMA